MNALVIYITLYKPDCTSRFFFENNRVKWACNEMCSYGAEGQLYPLVLYPLQLYPLVLYPLQLYECFITFPVYCEFFLKSRMEGRKEGVLFYRTFTLFTWG
jgi:hypothetical protein